MEHCIQQNNLYQLWIHHFTLELKMAKNLLCEIYCEENRDIFQLTKTECVDLNDCWKKETHS